MALPDTVDLERHRDLVGRGSEIWVRRLVLLVLLAIPVVALLNVFGQSPMTTEATARSASLSVNVPTSARGGLIYEAELRIGAPKGLLDPTSCSPPAGCRASP